MSKTISLSSETVQSDDIEDELDETMPLPRLPMWCDYSTGAANDESFSSQAMNENIERLIALAESIDEHLKVITEAVVSRKPKTPPSRKKKKRATKKRAIRKQATKQPSTT